MMQLFFLLATAMHAASAIQFTDVQSQTRQFMEWDKTIKLTPAQEQVKKAALTALPAPCCSDNTAYTCCCPCNLSVATWGLSKWLITKHNYTAPQLKAKVVEWFAFVSPKGFSGRGCYSGQCPRPFKEGGCGGMNPASLKF
jgi:hypothetical protein